jgi:hypothetical protein
MVLQAYIVVLVSEWESNGQNDLDFRDAEMMDELHDPDEVMILINLILKLPNYYRELPTVYFWPLESYEYCDPICPDNPYGSNCPVTVNLVILTFFLIMVTMLIMMTMKIIQTQRRPYWFLSSCVIIVFITIFNDY